MAVVLAVGIQSFLIARSEKASAPCINLLRQIVAAKDQWALEKGKKTNDVPSWDDIRPYFPSVWTNTIPVCPDGGTYTIGRIGEFPTCSIGRRGHTLPKGEGQ